MVNKIKETDLDEFIIDVLIGIIITGFIDKLFSFMIENIKGFIKNKKIFENNILNDLRKYNR
jgi:hypothetical protein